MKALITGASSGIGRDMAKNLARRGYDLVLVARDKNRLESLKEEILKYNSIKIDLISIDLAIEENCKDLYKTVPDVDILINNAGFGDCGNFTNTDLNKELKMIHTNIIAYHILMKLYLIDMKAKNSGIILNVASIAGFMPGPLMSTYYSTKAYIVRISESIREELKKEKSKVQISILCPGPVDTNFNKVANVKFQMREAKSQKVADYAINKMLKKKFYIIPGIDVKLAIFFSRFIPSKWIAKITYKVQKRKLKN
ncbi:MAG: SDR family oxidoreductase [Clostridia bacterium]|nr:SDR family oxidoreductase [Clostridia bacterium]